MVKQQEYSRFQEQQLTVLRKIALELEKTNKALEIIAIEYQERARNEIDRR